MMDGLEVVCKLKVTEKEMWRPRQEIIALYLYFCGKASFSICASELKKVDALPNAHDAIINIIHRSSKVSPPLKHTEPASTNHIYCWR